MIITEAIFHALLKGRGGKHAFVPLDKLLDDDFDTLVTSIEKEHKFSAWQKNVGLACVPLTDAERNQVRRAVRRFGYLAYLNNEEVVCGDKIVEYCEINLTRFDLSKTAMG